MATEYLFVPLKNEELLRDDQGNVQVYMSASAATMMLDFNKQEWDEIAVYKKEKRQ